MARFEFDTVEQVNNVIAQLPEKARGPDSGIGAAPLLYGRYELTVPDEFVAAVKAANPAIAEPTPVRTVRKSTVMARVTTAGKIVQGYAALQANPALFGRWFAPDRPVVKSDDPDTITFLRALGLNAEDILGPE